MPRNVTNRVLFRAGPLTVYLVHYPEGHSILPHVDGISGGRLYKLNCVLVKPAAGGEFVCERTIFDLFGRFVLFRADRYQHRVTRIECGSRWLLSFALARP